MRKIVEAKITTKVSTKGSVNLPVEVLTVLGIGPRDEITFEVKNGQVFVNKTGINKVSSIFDFDEFRNARRSDNLKLSNGLTVEYKIQKIVKKIG